MSILNFRSNNPARIFLPREKTPCLYYFEKLQKEHCSKFNKNFAPKNNKWFSTQEITPVFLSFNSNLEIFSKSIEQQFKKRFDPNRGYSFCYFVLVLRPTIRLLQFLWNFHQAVFSRLNRVFIYMILLMKHFIKVNTAICSMKRLSAQGQIQPTHNSRKFSVFWPENLIVMEVALIALKLTIAHI